MGDKIVTTGLEFFEAIGHPEILQRAKFLQEKGVLFECSFYNVLFKKPDGSLIAKTNLPSSTVTWMKGKLKGAALELCVKAMLASLTTVEEITLGLKFPVPPSPQTAKAPSFVPAAKSKSKPKTSTPEAVLQSVEATISASTLKGEVVPLAKATKVLQQVRGTSESSVYICVAVSDNVNLAVRYRGASVSFRIEKTSSGKFPPASMLSSMGFSSSQTHWSMHFDVAHDNKSLRARVLGSVVAGLFSIGIAFKDVELNIDKIPEGI